MSAAKPPSAEQFKERVLQEWTDPNTVAAWCKWHSKIAVASAEAKEALVRAAQVEPGMQVLDIASGTGEPALTLAEMVDPEGHVTVRGDVLCGHAPGTGRDLQGSKARGPCCLYRLGTVGAKPLLFDLPCALLEAGGSAATPSRRSSGLQVRGGRDADGGVAEGGLSRSPRRSPHDLLGLARTTRGSLGACQGHGGAVSPHHLRSRI